MRREAELNLQRDRGTFFLPHKLPFKQHANRMSLLPTARSKRPGDPTNTEVEQGKRACKMKNSGTHKGRKGGSVTVGFFHP